MNRHKVALINIRRRYLKGAGMRGFHLCNESEISMIVELWVGVTPSGWSPVIWIPMERGPGGCEVKGRGLDQRCQAL
jgi:hypothetical protein